MWRELWGRSEGLPHSQGKFRPGEESFVQGSVHESGKCRRVRKVSSRGVCKSARTGLHECSFRLGECLVKGLIG